MNPQKNLKQKINEAYTEIILGIVSIILAVLILAKIINLKTESTNMIIVIFIAMGIITIVHGTIRLLRERKYLHTTFNDLMEDYNNNLIKSKILALGVEVDDIKVEELGIYYSIEITKNGYLLEISISAYEVEFYYDKVENSADENSNDSNVINYHISMLELQKDELYEKIKEILTKEVL